MRRGCGGKAAAGARKGGLSVGDKKVAGVVVLVPGAHLAVHLPADGAGILPQHLPQQSPEAGAVVHLPAVAQLVAHGIIHITGREEQEIEGQIDVPQTGIAAPLAGSALDGKAVVAQPGALRPPRQPRGEDEPRLPAQGLAHHIAEPGLELAHIEEGAAGAVDGDMPRIALAEEMGLVRLPHIQMQEVGVDGEGKVYGTEPFGEVYHENEGAATRTGWKARRRKRGNGNRAGAAVWGSTTGNEAGAARRRTCRSWRAPPCPPRSGGGA